MALRRGLLRGSLLGSRALLTPAYQQSAIASTALHSIATLDDIRRNSRPYLRHTLFIEHPERWIEHLQRQHYSADAKQSSTKARSTSSVIPDAQQCDSAIENYTKLKSKYEEAVWEPPLPKSVGQRFADVWTILLKALIATKDFTLKVPGWIRTLSSMSAEDWRTWWAGAKKTIKHEAHHYWVRRRNMYPTLCCIMVARSACLQAWRFPSMPAQQMIVPMPAARSTIHASFFASMPQAAAHEQHIKAVKPPYHGL
jgi:hypothetical protein